MGNNLGGKGKAKVMRTNGEIIQYRTPIKAGDVMKDYDGHILLESEEVKRLSIRATPLGMQETLKPKNIYFLVETSMFSKKKIMRRAYSDINTSAKDRLERLTLHRRSMSDFSVRQAGLPIDAPNSLERPKPHFEPVQVKVKLPKSQLTKLVKESWDEGEWLRRLLSLFGEVQ